MLKSRKIKLEKNYSIDLSACYAKTCYSSVEHQKTFGKNVDTHCKIVGKIAEFLIYSFCNQQVRKLFPSNAPLIAALHDLGKISPTFQLKLVKAVYGEDYDNNFSFLNDFKDFDDSSFGGHPTVSYAALKSKNLQAATVVGQHHGALHPASLIKDDNAEIFGGELWQEARNKEQTELSSFFNAELSNSLTSTQISLLSGLTCVSDWIGSGSFFDNHDYKNDKNLKKAILAAGFKKYPIKKKLSFKELFGFSPTQMQKDFIKAISRPGLYVIEAPMGTGKTELALYTAYKLLSSGKNSGIYFALPTQLTSNKIHERLQPFLDTILQHDEDSQALLLHSNAFLVSQALGSDAKPGNSWFSSAKRGLLYPFAVGTIDQALMSVMKVRHSFVRSFGLAGKVVIIDEVHTYDCYTGTILDTLIEHLLALQCSVIILSATLNVKRRSELFKKDTLCQQYPVMTYQTNGTNDIKTVIPTPLDNKHIKFAFKKEETCIEEALKRAGQNQQVLWIENTVADAQHIYRILQSKSSDLNVECGLLHSKFTNHDRECNENYWVNILGKNDPLAIRSKKGRILVGTQVLEQSLDIDADFLISRFAPTDMLLQRVGRLWRHSQTRRPQDAKTEVWIVDVDLPYAIASKGMNFNKSSLIYSPYILCRSLEVWKEHCLKSGGILTLPQEIRGLIDKTYADRLERDEFAQMHHELVYGNKKNKGTEALKSLAKSSTSEIGIVMDDDNASTRYIEEESVDIILLKKILKIDADTIEFIFLDDSSELLHQSFQNNSKELRKASLKLQLNMVKCSKSKAPTCLSVAECRAYGLSNYLYLKNHNELSDISGFALMVVKDSGVLENVKVNEDDKYVYKYSDKTGFEVIKK